MTDFDKLEYWKGRIRIHLQMLFDAMTLQIRDIVSDERHIGVPKEELDKALRMIGDGFDKLRELSEKVIALRREPEIIMPAPKKIITKLKT